MNGQSGSSIYTSCGLDGCVVGRGILLHKHGGVCAGDISESGHLFAFFLQPQTAFSGSFSRLPKQQASSIGSASTHVKVTLGKAAVTPVYSPRPSRYVEGIPFSES